MNNVFQKRTNIIDFSKRKNIGMNFGVLPCGTMYVWAQ